MSVDFASVKVVIKESYYYYYYYYYYYFCVNNERLGFHTTKSHPYRARYITVRCPQDGRLSNRLNV